MGCASQSHYRTLLLKVEEWTTSSKTKLTAIAQQILNLSRQQAFTEFLHNSPSSRNSATAMPTAKRAENTLKIEFATIQVNMMNNTENAERY